MGYAAVYGARVSLWMSIQSTSVLTAARSLYFSGYLKSCRSIVTCAKTIEAAIREEIPELYVLGEPVASCVAFASNTPSVNVLEVGDIMSTKGWHLNGLSNPAAVHIACTVRTMSTLFGVRGTDSSPSF